MDEYLGYKNKWMSQIQDGFNVVVFNTSKLKTYVEIFSEELENGYLAFAGYGATENILVYSYTENHNAW